MTPYPRCFLFFKTENIIGGNVHYLAEFCQSVKSGEYVFAHIF